LTDVFFRATQDGMNAEQVRELLRAKINGNQAAWAKAHTLSPSYISDVLSGRREPGEAVMRALGLERIVTYRKASA
jgi:predicted transcriptional regulator